jgi:hypothetical protein
MVAELSNLNAKKKALFCQKHKSSILTDNAFDKVQFQPNKNGPGSSIEVKNIRE